MFWLKAPEGKRGVTKVDQYLVVVGDRVSSGQVVADIETDKVSYELVSPVSGVVRRIFVKPGVTADVGTPLIEIEEDPTVR